MATFYSPPFVTETNETPPFTDCTWAAGLMLANKASFGKYPSTRAEREALRAASGDRTGGSSLYDLALGIKDRYGWTLPHPAISHSSFALRMARGDGAVLQGLYAALPEHFQRWDRHFASLGARSTHAMYFQGHDRGSNQHLDANGNPTLLFVCDPNGRAPYRGEWISFQDAMIYASAIWSPTYLLVATMPQGSIK